MLRSLGNKFNNLKVSYSNSIRYYSSNSNNSFNSSSITMTPPIVSIQRRVEKLKELMAARSLNVYVIPSEDAHQSEYITVRDKRREYISGFTGSSGAAVITSEGHRLLWTDGRYWLQASQQLDATWKVMKDRVAGEPTIEEWIATTMPANTRVGMDSRLISKSAFDKFKSTVEKSGQTVETSEVNLIDQVREQFASEEPVPGYPANPIFFLPVEFSGKASSEKIRDIQQDSLVKENADYMVISALDEIAWLFNLRGSDISFNPVFLSYAIVGRQNVQLFVDETKIPTDVRKELAGVEILPYDSIFSVLRKYCSENKKIWLDPRSSLAIYNSVQKEHLFEKTNPILLAKAIKNATEVEGFRQCHIRDAAALIQFLAWMEEEMLVKNNTGLTEYSVAEVLEQYRAKQKHYVSLSFDTISSTEGNGAIIHYKPEPETCKKIARAMYLVDSGGQYRDGTTDVTRTVHYGTPNPHEVECYTRVLKGHVQLSIVKFPLKVTGKDIDCIARMSLWQVGLDYAHGTGHGVGSFLNVHEGPQGITHRQVANPPVLQPYMTVTNEPGYYEEGKFGIRIENVMVTVPVDTPFSKQFLGFETVTVVPYERDLINVSMLTDEELLFVNNYHQNVLLSVGPLLESDPRALTYLKKKTAPIAKQ
ncbi:peptidase M24 family protein [Heterostelium album PN500]|uniref:Peptidase M24 family protein n=1 Tax=Heterostelium pallidum (strain ATCC 26659 / Pp 5 / PN500) TaxID=670386 RepID=D3B7I3_HETP5|nr:peptidase M24 family protein [Heterostelium album PN500]EFA82726.1 peptidase M24 family protein [Heterostelium album PN500]|eukprot:XP_020434843.1 peptidase M24 family protein [Heterostelium album PN500]